MRPQTDYIGAFETAERIVTDQPLSDEAVQNFELFQKYINEDGHPDAIAVALKLYLKLADAPVKFVMDIPFLLLLQPLHLVDVSLLELNILIVETISYLFGF